MELEQLSLNGAGGGGPTTLLIRHRNNTICLLFRFYFFSNDYIDDNGYIHFFDCSKTFEMAASPFSSADTALWI